MSDRQTSLDEVGEVNDNSEDDFRSIRIGPRKLRIPTDWEIRPLDPEEGATSRVTDGAHHSPNQSEDGEYYYATVSDISSDRIDYDGCGLIDSEQYNNLVEGDCKPRRGEVLFSKDGTVGLTTVFNDDVDVVLLSSIAMIDPVDDILNPHYLSQYLSSDFTEFQIQSLKSGTAIRRVVLMDIEKIEVPIPSLKEQRRIATVLHTVDQAIQKTKEIIDKKKNIRKLVIDKQLSEGFFEHDNIYSKKDLSIFEGGINTDLDRTSVGTVPQDWDTVRLEEITESSLYGVAESAEEYDAQKPRYIRITDISSDGRLKSDEPASLSSDKFDEKYMMSDGEILFARSGATVGKTYLYQSNDPSSVYGGYLIRYVPNTQRALPKYIFYYTQSTAYSNWVTRVTRKGAQANINAGEYASILLPLPPIREQKRIVDVITSHERAIAKEIQYRNNLNRVKQGLMQELLSGEVRTTDADIDIPEEIAKYG